MNTKRNKKKERLIMKHIEYNTCDVCSKKIIFDIDDEGKIINLTYVGGCNGNLKAIGKLCEGKDALEIAKLLEGNTCGWKQTSCADQLSKAILANK